MFIKTISGRRKNMTDNHVENFNKNGFCIVRSVISKELQDFVTQYALFDEMQDFHPDGSQVPEAHAKYADPAMETMLLHLHPSMELYTGLKLYPTYSFFRVYRSGDELTVHRDRPSCEVSATLCLNYNYDDEQYQWPIYIGDNIAANLRPGDMLIYRGCDLNHWREKFNVDDSIWHIQGFFHYVNTDGPHAEYKNDQRQSIGILKKTKTPRSKSYVILTG